MPPAAKSKRSNTSHLRIIGGQWRRRNISFIEMEGVRPTPNRIRETLFNWLAPVIQGARCLDLFAGSGILAIEALSRGANHATLVDKAPAVCRHIKSELDTVAAHPDSPQYEIINSDALHWLDTDSQSQAFDIIFLDPPFAEPIVLDCINKIARQRILAANGLLYVESANPISALDLPQNWQLQRAKSTGMVHYHLIST